MLSSEKGKSNRFSSILISSGVVLIGVGVLIFAATFYPVAREEIKYTVSPKKINKEIIPVDPDFGIVIPKIEANAKIVANVDPYNEKEYQWALTKGVAQAKGTATPGHVGNVFLFAHSSDNWYNANRYNAVFYLLTKLEKGDKIYLYYKGQKYTYEVYDKKFADPKNVQYLKPFGAETTVTLMTCWPPGTTLQRLLIFGKIALDK